MPAGKTSIQAYKLLSGYLKNCDGKIVHYLSLAGQRFTTAKRTDKPIYK